MVAWGGAPACRETSLRTVRVDDLGDGSVGAGQRTTALSGDDTSYSVTLPTGWLTINAPSTTAL